MAYLLTLFAFCAAAAYISTPFWSRQAASPTIHTAVADEEPVSVLSSDDRRLRMAAEAEAEILIARARRRKRLKLVQQVSVAQGWECTQCGRGMGRYDRFCASCGAARPEPGINT